MTPRLPSQSRTGSRPCELQAGSRDCLLTRNAQAPGGGADLAAEKAPGGRSGAWRVNIRKYTEADLRGLLARLDGSGDYLDVADTVVEMRAWWEIMRASGRTSWPPR